MILCPAWKKGYKCIKINIPRQIFPVRVLWYRDGGGRLVPVNGCKCASCGKPLVSDGFWFPAKLGLSKETMYHVIAPRVQCVRCRKKRHSIFVDGSVQPPQGSEQSCRMDCLLKRVVDMDLTDWLCRTFRKHWNQEALRASYMDLIGTMHRSKEMPPNLLKMMFLYFRGGVPSARQLATMVLLTFQHQELPTLEHEVRWVCARFGVVVATDGSSAPLQEARRYVRKEERKQQGSRGPGAAIRALGLFDIPLCPPVFVPTDSRGAAAELMAFIVSQASMVDAEALPIGWVQDNTESLWASMVHVVTKLMHAHTEAGRIVVCSESKEVQGFFIGIDPKHVEWRLQDALDTRSADFLQAAWALRTLFSTLFNPSVHDDVNAPQEEAVAESTNPEEWVSVWCAWLLNDKVDKQVAAVGKSVTEAYKQSVRGEGQALALWRSDGKRPPRAVVSNFLSAIGCGKCKGELWDDGDREASYMDELQAFSAWFAVPMAAWKVLYIEGKALDFSLWSAVFVVFIPGDQNCRFVCAERGTYERTRECGSI